MELSLKFPYPLRPILRKSTASISQVSSSTSYRSPRRDEEKLMEEIDLTNLVTKAPYFGIPYMKFGQHRESWKDIYECIFSPLPNKYQTFISHKKAQKVLEDIENEKKKRISGLIRQVQQKLEDKGLGNLYTGKELLDMVMLAYKMKEDTRYKEKILCSNNLENSAKIRRFLRDTKGVIGEVLESLKDVLSDGQSHKVPKIKIKPVPKKVKLKNRSHSFLLEVQENDAELQEDNFMEQWRGKSCCCHRCGGAKYYNKFQKRINLFRLPSSITHQNQKLHTLPIKQNAQGRLNLKKITKINEAKSAKLQHQKAAADLLNLKGVRRQIKSSLVDAFYKKFSIANPLKIQIKSNPSTNCTSIASTVPHSPNIGESSKAGWKKNHAVSWRTPIENVSKSIITKKQSPQIVKSGLHNKKSSLYFPALSKKPLFEFWQKKGAKQPKVMLLHHVKSASEI